MICFFLSLQKIPPINKPPNKYMICFFLGAHKVPPPNKPPNKIIIIENKNRFVCFPVPRKLLPTGFIRSGKVRNSQDLVVPKSGKTTILIKVRNSQENGCHSQEKVRIFVFFAIWKSTLVKNGLTFIAVILFNLTIK